MATPRLTVAQTNLAGYAMTQTQAAPLFAPVTFSQNETGTTDANRPFSSSPETGPYLASQQVSLLYNAWRAGAAPPRGIYSVQNTAQFYPSESNATNGYNRLDQVNSTIFQNTVKHPGPTGFDQSVCYSGAFPQTSGQSYWYFCAARRGNGTFTTAVGSLQTNVVETARQAIDAYYQSLRGQLP